MANSYYENVNEDVLRLIPPDAKTVLEVGCGAGALGRAYKMNKPLVRYIGLEVFAEVAEMARQYLDIVVCGDTEAITLDSILSPDEKIDCLIYGDVLEHLRDPWRVLKEQAVWLADGGQVIACIPNVQHWTVLANLLSGQWHYSKNGLLDRTHIRFFTLDTMKELFAQAGLHINRIYPRIFDHPEMGKIQNVLATAAVALGIEDTSVNRVHTAAFQYVIRATKRSARNQG